MITSIFNYLKTRESGVIKVKLLVHLTTFKIASCWTRFSYCGIYILRINFHCLKLHEIGDIWPFDVLRHTWRFLHFISRHNLMMLLIEHSSVRPRAHRTGKWKAIADRCEVCRWEEKKGNWSTNRENLNISSQIPYIFLLLAFLELVYKELDELQNSV